MIKKFKGDITKLEKNVDVVINAANTELVHSGGVALAIQKAAGEVLKEESKKIGEVSLGDFAVTSAGNLKAKKVIHIPTVDLREGKWISYEQLKDAWRKALEYCQKEGYKTIATPLLGTGVVELDKEKVEKILADVANEFNSLEITVVEYSPIK